MNNDLDVVNLLHKLRFLDFAVKRKLTVLEQADLYTSTQKLVIVSNPNPD